MAEEIKNEIYDALDGVDIQVFSNVLEKLEEFHSYMIDEIKNTNREIHNYLDNLTKKLDESDKWIENMKKEQQSMIELRKSIFLMFHK